VAVDLWQGFILWRDATRPLRPVLDLHRRTDLGDHPRRAVEEFALRICDSRLLGHDRLARQFYGWRNEQGRVRKNLQAQALTAGCCRSRFLSLVKAKQGASRIDYTAYADV
jgi:hypothetical protein